MNIDFSIFDNPDNVIFFLIYLVIIVVVILIFILIIRSILKFFKKIFFKKENIHTDKGQDLGVTVKELDASKQERAKSFGNNTAGPKLQYASHPDKKEQPKVEKDVKRSWDQKEQKDIASGLESFKAAASGKEVEKKSPYPTRGESNDKGAMGEQIKIPRARRFDQKEKQDETKPTTQKNVLEKSSTTEIEKKAVEDLKNSIQEHKEADRTSKYSIKNTSDFSNAGLVVGQSNVSIPRPEVANKEGQLPTSKEEIPLYQKPEFMKNELAIGGGNKVVKNSSNVGGKDNTIFSGKQEVSRIDLRHKLRYDPKAWQAQRDSGLTLSPVERTKLEKEVLPQAYGRNISKTDLRWGVKKLSQKMISSTNLAEKTKIRKEIKFIKKIGGLK